MAAPADAVVADAPRDAPGANCSLHADTLTLSDGLLAGHHLATYRWDPPGRPTGVIFILHGIFAHCRHEFLDDDAAGGRTRYAGSLVEALVNAGLVVVGHDYVGHGASSGVRGYFGSMDWLVDGALAVVDAVLGGRRGGPAGSGSAVAGPIPHAADGAGGGGRRDGGGGDADLWQLPVFLGGMSLGGAVAILTSLKRPHQFAGVALMSPAVHPPASMFGVRGKILAALSGVLSATLPRMPMMRLPPHRCPTLRAAVEADPLYYTGGVRCRVARSVLRMYEEVGARREEVRGHWLVCSGAKDRMVNAEGIRAWVAGVAAGAAKGGGEGGAHVTERRYDHMGHELLRADGTAQVRAEVVSWVKKLC